MTVQQTIEQFLLAWNSNAYLNMCTSDDMKNAIESMEKQIPKKPTDYIEAHSISPTTVNFEKIYQCENCHSIVKEEWNFCTLCGQALKWGEEDD